MKKQIFLAAAVVVLALPGTASATNGYISHGYGAKSKAMAGAGTALVLDTINGATNPATMVHLGGRTDFGAALFSPRRRYTADNNGYRPGDPGPPFPSFPAGTYDSDKEYFLIPNFGYSRMLDNESSIGISVYGSGGMNTEYPNAVFAPFNPVDPATGQAIPGAPVASSPAGVDLAQLLIGVSYSQKLNDQHSLGILPIFAVQRFKAYGLEPFMGFSESPRHVTNNGYDISYGGGLRLGWFGQLTDQISAGAYYQTKLWMSNFDDYKGLFAEQGDFDLPAQFSLGIAFKAAPTLTLAFDIQHIRFSEISSVSNKHDIPFFDYSAMATVGRPTPRTLLGTSDGIGFGWDDMTVGKLGAAWDFRPDMTLRAGYSHANQAIPSTQGLFNIIAPAVITDHITFGLTWQTETNSDLNFSFMYALNEEVSGSNPNVGPQTGSIEMEQYELEVSWGMRF